MVMSFIFDMKQMSSILDMKQMSLIFDIKKNAENEKGMGAMELKSQAGLGQVVRAARTRNGWSQQDLAVRAGLSRQSMVALEQGESNPRWDTVLRLLSALGLELDLKFGEPADLALNNLAFNQKRRSRGKSKVEGSNHPSAGDSLTYADSKAYELPNYDPHLKGSQPSLLDEDGQLNLDALLDKFRGPK